MGGVAIQDLLSLLIGCRYLSLPMNEWINVKDRLPKHREHVIGYCMTKEDPNFHVEPLLFECHENSYITWAYLFAYNEGYAYAREVTHWMHLPEPPEDGCPPPNEKDIYSPLGKYKETVNVPLTNWMPLPISPKE